ncbi:MAG: sensor domain-containing diguanylate cyclase [Oscillospiraceae bacterium]|nr:sensor domain-containing diguanylate cyclase [Oscillospiraceae bacterium]MDY6208922.1 sensor domain-containing diguanylate cyclase [Oscillospiraceae bacterium]
MSENFHKTTLMSLKSRIMLYTVLPVLVIIIITGGFMTISVRRVIDSVSRSEAAGSTELACSRVGYMISSYGEAVEMKAGIEDIERFLQTAEDRDTIEYNAYFSLTMGELDSAVSDAPESLERTWLVSSKNQGVAFSNSSDGWTAKPDFEFSMFPFSDDLNYSESYYITDLYVSPISGKTVISAVAPVRDHRTGEIIGYFGADIKLGGLWVKISELPESKNNEIYIITSDNTVIYHSDVNMIYRKFSKLGIVPSGSGSYFDGERELVGSAENPGNCGWTIYALRDFSSAQKLIDRQTRITVITFLAVAAMLVVTISIVSNKVVKPLQNYTKKINSIQLMGDNVGDDDFLHPEGCRELEHFAVGFNSLLQRNHEMMSQLREMNIKSEKERKLYQTALQSSSDVVFEYDIETDCLITYGSVFDPDLPKTIANSHEAFMKRVLACNGFRAKDTDSTTRFFSGETACGAVVARIDAKDNVNWIEFSGTAVYADSKPVKIVGKISNIDDVVSLREDASRDRFTGLYNKTTTEALISERLEKGGSHAMIIIDVDNFKNVNDILGHAWGDSVIKDIATKIEALLNCGDIAGRIGGDEFMAFLSGDDVSERINGLCAALCDSIRYTYSDESLGRQVSVSSSIGVAFAPQYGRDFKELYTSADIAMYFSKNGGKDRFTVYSGQERREYKGNRAE